eukprot:GHVN01037245.1.p1 GENE.GHVN01037245.1~~GHVN01037245.1.p1  ORF type:complete len:421 (+),score=18.50 GHVN01037245.1:275-1537(+)
MKLTGFVAVGGVAAGWYAMTSAESLQVLILGATLVSVSSPLLVQTAFPAASLLPHLSLHAINFFHSTFVMGACWPYALSLLIGTLKHKDCKIVVGWWLATALSTAAVLVAFVFPLGLYRYTPQPGWGEEHYQVQDINLARKLKKWREHLGQPWLIRIPLARAYQTLHLYVGVGHLIFTNFVEATYLLSGRSLLNSTIGAEVANHYMNIFNFMLPIFCSALPALVSLGFFPYYAFGFNGVVGLMVASAFAGSLSIGLLMSHSLWGQVLSFMCFFFLKASNSSLKTIFFMTIFGHKKYRVMDRINHVLIGFTWLLWPVYQSTTTSKSQTAPFWIIVGGLFLSVLCALYFYVTPPLRNPAEDFFLDKGVDDKTVVSDTFCKLQLFGVDFGCVDTHYTYFLLRDEALAPPDVQNIYGIVELRSM